MPQTPVPVRSGRPEPTRAEDRPAATRLRLSRKSFGPTRYAYYEKRIYTPADTPLPVTGPIESARRERAVLVQPSPYGMDNSACWTP